MGTPKSARPTIDGTVRNRTMRSPRRSVPDKAAQSFRAASRDRCVRAVVPTATPNTPIGSCMRRKAYDSHEIAPSTQPRRYPAARPAMTPMVRTSTRFR